MPGLRGDASVVVGGVFGSPSGFCVTDCGALVSHVGGEGFRPIAERLGVPASTVRDWFRRFRVNAGGLALLFRSWALRLDPGLDPPLPTGTEAGDALECLGLAARAVVLRFGPRPVSATVARLTGGGLLANTSSPWRRPG